MGTADNGGRFADGTGDVTENVVMRLVFHDCIPYTDGSGNFWNIQKHWKYHKFKTVASQEIKKGNFDVSISTKIQMKIFKDICSKPLKWVKSKK